MEGLETGHAPPRFVLGVGQSRVATLTESVGPEKVCKSKGEGSQGSQHHPALRQGSPKHYIQAPRR